MATVARLNQVASQTPHTARKRPRTSDLQDVTPQKRRAIEDDVQQQRTIETRSTGRRSATRLRNRSSLPASTPAPKPRGADVYQLQDSPNQDGETKKPKERPQEEKKGTKKKRLLNRIGDKKPTGAEGFDRRRQSAFDPSKARGVTLSTVDSPAKNTRAKRELPLKKLDTDFLKIVPVDAEPTREASPELGLVSGQERPPTSGQPSRKHNEVDSEDGVEETDHDDERQTPSRDISPGHKSHHTEQEDDAAIETGFVDGDAAAAQDSAWQQPVTELDRNYMAREQEKQTRQRQQEKRKSMAKHPGAASEDQPDSSKGRGKRSGLQSQIQREDVDICERTDPEEDGERHNDVGATEAQAEPTQRKGRPKMTEEEKNAKKEEAARKRQENAMETEAAEIQDFESRARDFIEGIEDLAVQVGGLESWSKLGAGAKTITKMVARKTQMKEARAQNLWMKLKHLKNIFSGKEEADEDRISHLIRGLKDNSTWVVLTRKDDIKQGDTTIIDIYEQLIPASVYVLKKALKERFVAAHKVSWLELRDLTEIAISLCDVASAWRPKPSNLEGGIRKQVRQHIRPNLVTILNTIKETVTQIEWRERKKRELASFAKRQELKRQEKRRMWEKMNLECPSHQLPQPGGYVSSNRGSQRAADEVNQVEEMHDGEVQHPASNLSNHSPPQPFLRRRPTEEIPAPDPNITWTEKENVALLNGLQKYLNEDRYARIMEDPKFAKALREKDVEQCMAQARFYQAGCSQILKEKAEAGDGSFDWLRTV